MNAEFTNGHKIYVIHDFLTSAECEEHIERSEQIGYDDALIRPQYGRILRTAGWRPQPLHHGLSQGGETAFHKTKPLTKITPKQGKALVFYYRQVLKGMPVITGRKNVLRTVSMYRRS